MKCKANVAQEPNPDLSVILTAHDETLVSGPTMQSADAAIAVARAAGLVVEALIVLDNATPECTAWFSQPALDHWDRITLSEGDLGRARNAAVKIARGAFIAFLDADDLVSENWLSEGCKLLQAARDAGEKRIVHPELNWLFDGGKSVYFKPDQDDRLFTPWYFYAMNYYDSMALCPREVHEEIPYGSRDIPNGLSFQDWQFSVETMGAGWRHVSAKDTIIFKRRRDNSLVTESRTRQAIVRELPPMAIDAIDALGAPHNRKPQTEPARPALIEMQRESAAPQSKSLLTKVSRRLGFSQPEPVVQESPQAPLKTPPPPSEPFPHTGKTLAQRVHYARYHADPDPARDLEGYDRVAQAMDLEFYLSTYPDLAQARKVDPVGHYIRKGAEENRNPQPYFGTRQYLDRYPEAEDDPAGPLNHYLTKGAAQGHITVPFKRFEEMAAILGMSPQAAQGLLKERYSDIRARLEHGVLGEMVHRAAGFEPLISGTWPEALSLRMPPFHGDVVISRVAAIHALCQAAGLKRARAVICVNKPRWGGARRMEGHIAHALATGIRADEIVLISTDGTGELPKGRLPDGVRYVPFANLVEPLKGDEAMRTLVQFLRALRPEAVFNVNSRLMWDALGPYGRAMKASFRMIGCLFCNEQTLLGHATGYPLTRVYRNFDVLDAIVTDSHALADELRTRHMLPEEAAEKIRVLCAPADGAIPLATPPTQDPERRRQVFWSGRFDAQKRLDIVYDIARARPDLDFRLWGASVMTPMRAWGEAPDNIIFEGTYKAFADLPMQEADLWLYTSGWDGVPSILLEVAMTGVPLVGTDVGGTSEVLRKGQAEAVPHGAPTGAYMSAIEKILADPEAARARGQALRDHLLANRTAGVYADRVFALLTGEDTE